MNQGKRLVIKVGSSSLCKENGKLDYRHIEKLVRTLADLKNSNHEIVLVSSGAIAAGIGRLNLTERPKEIPVKQACAAVGQCELMSLYDRLFLEYGYTTAQILLTKSILDDVHGKENAINTINTLLQLNTIPIVNENDTIAFDEIVYGDNDTLSAIVAILCKADKLILLSDIDGLYDDNPSTNPNAKRIPLVTKIDEELLNVAKDSSSKVGTGGMITKLHAAQLVNEKGIDMIIASADEPFILYDLLEGKNCGTLFLGRKQ